MKIKVEESKKIKDGMHTGKISDVKYRTVPYEYTDVVIDNIDGDKSDFSLSVGYPSKITEDSALGNMLKRFGATLKIGQTLEVEEFLSKGQDVEFMSLSKKSPKDGKTYSNIINDSLKPL